MSQQESNGLKLLLATRIHAPEDSAASFRLEAVEKAALEQGWAVQVLTSRFQGVRSEASPRYSVSRWPVLRDSTGYLRGYIPYMSFDVPLFFRLLAAPRPDVVLVEPPPTTGVVVRLACGIRRIPYVWYAADIWSDATRAIGAADVVSKVVTWMEKFAIKGAAAVVAVTDDLAPRAEKLGGKNVHVVQNGIDTETYNLDVPAFSVEELAKFGITRPYLIYAGTASEWQRAEKFAQVFAQTPELYQTTQLVFVGNGSSWVTIGNISTALNAELGLQDGVAGPIIQMDSQPAKVVARLMRGAQAALVSLAPGQGYEFAYPTKVLAALSSGIPIVYSGVGPAVEDIDRNKFGWVVPFDSKQIKHSLQTAARIGQGITADFPVRAQKWVQTNRSIAQTGCQVVAVLTEVAKIRRKR